ncbi:signal peptidase I [Microbacterium sp. 4R-513]|nr:signal peptidase I [Microbacterium sp. 4R-513]
MRNAVLGVLAVLLVLATTAMAPGFSSASFTAQTANAANRVGAAADWTPPTVSVQAPAGTLRDVATITATAADGETGIAQVVISAQTAGSTTWTTLCTATAAPYSCSWDTRTVVDGSYSLRAIATDKAGYSTTSAVVAATVGNTIGVVLADPGDFAVGSVTLATTLQNTGAGPYAVRVEYAVAGTGAWTALCTNLASPYSCVWNTASKTFTNGESYDLRSAATYNGVTTYSNVVADVLVDNSAPTVSIVDPGSPLRGTITLAANASDGQSGVAKVVIQYAPSGTSNWTDACTLTLPPYTCRFGTTALANGSYIFRAVATDASGQVASSAPTSARTVDNSVASVAMEDPGAYLTGTASLAATANSTAGVASVAIQVAASGTTTWTTICALTAEPFTCAWNTKAVADGLYDFRAVMTDKAGKQTTSAVLGSRRVDNRPVRGADVQTANGGGIAGRLDGGDTITFTYSTQMSPASISAGWNGSATAVTLRLRDGNVVGLTASDDTLDILRGTAAVNLGSVDLRGDYVKNNKTSQWNATMTATTVTVNGLPVTAVQIVLGTLNTGGALRTAAASAGANMVWTPSSAATDLGGTTSSNAPVTESGALDREF